MIRGDNQLGLSPFEVSALVWHDPVGSPLAVT
jgi:hypothetical protein